MKFHLKECVGCQRQFGKFKMSLVFLSLCCLFVGSKVMASELNEDMASGDITVVSDAHKKTYHGLTGSKEGFYRTLITINDLPALQVSGRDDFYYTLTVDGARLYIDCAYADARNSSNGARVSAGVCGLSMELGAEYEDIAQDLSNEWQETIFSFNTQDVSSDGYSHDYLLGEIGGVKIYDRYSSLSDLESALPKKIIRGPSGCYDFQNKVGFMVFLNGLGREPIYLDLIDFKGSIQVQRMQGEDLRRLAVESCH